MNTSLDIEVFTGGYFMTNGYVVKHAGNGRVVVIDAPEGISAFVTEKGLEVAALLLTHQHYDHVIDVAPLKAQFDCPVYARAQPDDDLTLKSVLADTFGWGWNVCDYQVDHLLEGKDESQIEVEGLQFELLHIPGHSPDSICFHHSESGNVFGGDVLFQEGIGRTDFPHGDGPELLSGIRRKLYPLAEETEVFPGHGPSTTIGHEKIHNPFCPAL